MKPKKHLGRVRRVRRDRRPRRGGPRRRRARDPAAAARSPRTSPVDLRRWPTPPGRARACCAWRGARRACADATCAARTSAGVRTWSLERLRARAPSPARSTCRALRRTGGAPDVPVPGRPAAIAACESGGDPHAVGGGGAFRGKYQFDYGTWAARRRQRRPGRGARGRAGPPRGACSTRRAGAVARGRCCARGRSHSLPRVDASALRAEFPVLADRAYLNAGTCGPLPHAAVRAGARACSTAAPSRRPREGVRRALLELRDRQRAAYAARARRRRGRRRADDVHERRRGPRAGGAGARPRRRGPHRARRAPGPARPADRRCARAAASRSAPCRSPSSPTPSARGRSWWPARTSAGSPARCAPRAWPQLDVPVLLDGAQGVGAVAFDVGALGCAFYAGSGQKWLCGPIGSGMLWVAPEWQRAPGADRRRPT